VRFLHAWRQQASHRASNQSSACHACLNLLYVITPWFPDIVVVLLSTRPVTQVTLRATGGHSSMPPVDGSSMSDRLGRFLSAMSSRPGPAELVHPTSDFLEGLGKLLPGK
jgi:hypothetical protein